MNDVLLYLFVFVLGLVLGSFYNVLIHRLPRGESVIHPPSHCPECGERIRWRDNIPLISYVLLRGRCRHCGSPISLRYPLVELLSGLLAVLSLYRWGLSEEALFHYVFFSLLLVSSVIDWYYFIIPPSLNFGALFFSLLISPFRESLSLQESLAGAFLGFLIPGLIYLYYVKVRKVEGIGLGDVILLGSVGAFGGPYGVFVSLALGSLIGLLFVIPLVVKYRSLQFAVPFGPFLSLGAFLGLFFREEIMGLLY
ncbi:MAG: prepilin peptidase [Aquificae bacterium]|nr:prepilin peptidase [Aquificota bacterium]